MLRVGSGAAVAAGHRPAGPAGRGRRRPRRRRRAAAAAAGGTPSPSTRWHTATASSASAPGRSSAVSTTSRGRPAASQRSHSATVRGSTPCTGDTTSTARLPRAARPPGAPQLGGARRVEQARRPAVLQDQVRQSPGPAPGRVAPRAGGEGAPAGAGAPSSSTPRTCPATGPPGHARPPSDPARPACRTRRARIAARAGRGPRRPTRTDPDAQRCCDRRSAGDRPARRRAALRRRLARRRHRRRHRRRAWRALPLLSTGHFFSGSRRRSSVLTDMLDGAWRGDARRQQRLRRLARLDLRPGRRRRRLRRPRLVVRPAPATTACSRGSRCSCLVAGLVVSYEKARAEGLGLRCDVGLAERAERLMLVLIGTFLSASGRRRSCSTSLLWVLALAERGDGRPARPRGAPPGRPRPVSGLQGRLVDAAYAAGWAVVRALPEPVAHRLFRARRRPRRPPRRQGRRPAARQPRPRRAGRRT